ncbi:MAG: hypothetical protein WCN95_13420 [bacterium]
MALKLKPVDPSVSVVKIEAPAGGITKAFGADKRTQSDVEIAVNAIAVLVYNTIHSYWMSVADFENTIRDRFPVLETALTRNPEIRFTISHQTLIINGEQADMENRYIKFLAEQLTKMNVGNFTLTHGMTVDEFKGLVSLLGKGTPPVAQMGGFIGAVATLGFKNVRTRNVVLKEINEDELIVARDQVDTEAIERNKQAESLTLAFLSDATTEPTEESIESLREVSRQPRKLAEVIAKVTDTRAGVATDDNKDERKQLVLDMLERFFVGLMRHPHTRSRTGKKSVERTLEDLKTELLKAIHAGPEDDISKAVEDIIERMVEGLKIAGVAVDYSKKLKALEESERRILRFIKAQGLEKLKQAEMEHQIGESGLDVSGWERLLAKSSIKAEFESEGASTDMEESASAIASLAAILGRLDSDIGRTKDDPESADTEKLAGDLRNASEKVASVVAVTERKIKALVDAVNEDGNLEETGETGSEATTGVRKLSRRQLVVILAEIVLEICQPLAVVKCSVEMLQLTKLGQVTPAQKSILDLAAQSIERIGILAKSLESVSGCSRRLAPDSGIIAMIYGKK